jgi:PAS domain S-box-containing protein
MAYSNRNLQKIAGALMNPATDSLVRSQGKAAEHAHLQESFWLDLLPAAVYVCESSGSVKWFNRHATELWGYSPQDSHELPCASFRFYYTESTAANQLDTPVKEVMKTGIPVHNREAFIERPDGTRLTVRVNIAPIRDPYGEVIGTINCFQDITHQKEAERRKDEFISVASHELKTPITSQKIYLELLRLQLMNNKDEKGLALLSKIMGQTDKITRLVNDLLNVTKIEAGMISMDEGRFDLDKCLHELVKEVQPVNPKHIIEVEGSIGTEVPGDETRIQQVITNLISNAVKYSPEADRVKITLYNDGENAVVAVRDYGIGISAEHQERVFERFFRVTGPNETAFPGMGVGLHLSADIVRRHNGRIWLESRLGEGSVFYFSLPLA